jgi:hypothetical protein
MLASMSTTTVCFWICSTPQHHRGVDLQNSDAQSLSPFISFFHSWFIGGDTSLSDACPRSYWVSGAWSSYRLSVALRSIGPPQADFRTDILCIVSFRLSTHDSVAATFLLCPRSYSISGSTACISLQLLLQYQLLAVISRLLLLVCQTLSWSALLISLRSCSLPFAVHVVHVWHAEFAYHIFHYFLLMPSVRGLCRSEAHVISHEMFQDSSLYNILHSSIPMPQSSSES